uniref:Uncharacterized protein n=1 Tax=Romanomermis culicivorax TaxID=13658 RepID=A0A915HR74_ROMCU
MKPTQLNYIDLNTIRYLSIIQDLISSFYNSEYAGIGFNLLESCKGAQIDGEEESKIWALKMELLEQQIANEKLCSQEICQNINTLATKERKDKAIPIFYESRVAQQQPCYSNEAMCYEKLCIKW